MSSAVPSAPFPPLDTAATRRARARLVAGLRIDAVTDEAVLDALAATPRHVFVPSATIDQAYRDEPQPIGFGQTISQPTIVGMMSQALELTGRESVLEIGTGCGYQAAILARLSWRVFSVELIADLGEAAHLRLAQLGHTNAEVRIGDGYRGWPERAPFDRIVVTAAPPELPPALLGQLSEGGILVVPVGEQDRVQRLLRLRKIRGEILSEDLGPVRFVPMVPYRG